MSEAEKLDLLKDFEQLPEDKRQFVLGYMAGIASARTPEEPPEKTDEQKPA